MDKDWEGHEIFIAYFLTFALSVIAITDIYSNCHPDVFVHPNLHPSYYIQVHYLRVIRRKDKEPVR